MKLSTIRLGPTALAAGFLAIASLGACSRSEDPHALNSPGHDAPQRKAQASEPQRYADANRDGRVTREEARRDPALAAQFDHYDQDHSGDLDRAEFAQLEAMPPDDTVPPKPAPMRPREEFPRGKP